MRCRLGRHVVCHSTSSSKPEWPGQPALTQQTAPAATTHLKRKKRNQDVTLRDDSQNSRDKKSAAAGCHTEARPPGHRGPPGVRAAGRGERAGRGLKPRSRDGHETPPRPCGSTPLSQSGESASGVARRAEPPAGRQPARGSAGRAAYPRVRGRSLPALRAAGDSDHAAPHRGRWPWPGPVQYPSLLGRLETMSPVPLGGSSEASGHTGPGRAGSRPHKLRADTPRARLGTPRLGRLGPLGRRGAARQLVVCRHCHSEGTAASGSRLHHTLGSACSRKNT